MKNKIIFSTFLSLIFPSLLINCNTANALPFHLDSIFKGKKNTDNNQNNAVSPFSVESDGAPIMHTLPIENPKSRTQAKYNYIVCKYITDFDNAETFMQAHRYDMLQKLGCYFVKEGSQALWLNRAGYLVQLAFETTAGTTMMWGSGSAYEYPDQ